MEAAIIALINTLTTALKVFLWGAGIMFVLGLISAIIQAIMIIILDNKEDQ